MVKKTDYRVVKTLGEKFCFMNDVFSNPRHRTKQKASLLTPIRAAVTAKIAQYYNLERKYSFVSERRIAKEIGCSQAAVNGALKWLENEGHIKRVDNHTSNKVSKYQILKIDDYSQEGNHIENQHENSQKDKSYRSNQNEYSHESVTKRNNGTQVKLKENGPSRSRSRRKTASPSRGPIDVNKAIKYLGI